MFDAGEATRTGHHQAAAPPTGAAARPRDLDDVGPVDDDDAPLFAGLPGPGLAAGPAAADPATLSGYDLVEAIGGWERLVSWAQARQLQAIAELAHRRPARAGQPGEVDTRTSGVSEFCVDEIAPALRLSRQGASLRLSLALDLNDRLPATWQALACGQISLPRARAVADGVCGLPDHLARAVEQRVLPRAAAQTPGQLRAAVARAVIAVDPKAADKRHDKEKTRRKVTTQPLPDGMGELVAYLTAVELHAAWAAVDATAKAAATPDDGRTMDQRRADALLDLLTGRPTPRPGQGRTQAGPAPGTPDCNDGDVRGTAHGDTAGPASAGDTSQTRASGTGTGVPAARAHVTVAATTLLGLDNQPAQLAGYGPIPAALARQLAADATWQAILTHPTTGTLTGLSRRSYTPGIVLGDHIRARDHTCRFPGCRQPARQCDIDHTIPHPAGPTAACNLACLCRHHHRCKQVPGWQLHQHHHGRLTWTTPTGHTYETQPPNANPAADP